MSDRYVLVEDAIADRREGRDPVAGACVVVPGSAAGGPAELVGAIVDVLIEAERAGAACVLLAGEKRDLDTAVAAVCRYVVADRPEVLEEARQLFGPDRVQQVESVAVDQIRSWIRQIPVSSAESVRLRRRVGAVAGQLKSARSIYGRMRRRRT
ncbi:hypothetical protein G1H11_17765 [Phytoactinopolyspora alkaliphila]|uniref:Uncharacterized protein n=1 Tax=Phytoactinopolyspora alkaliphila TaxID=1783498 RepID=A0A6N9YQQ5_9ACTN|nr:hypothetical protein [Phytoactinopolyspora alkaliphila]NED97149.1 hypothetical protein [Phytoactinopolyspora alkaliphila]